MIFRGNYYNGKCSKAISAHLQWSENNLVLHIEEESKSFSARNIKFLAPIGSFPAKIIFPDNGIFEFTENWEILAKKIGWNPWIHNIEKSWRWAGISSLIFVSTIAIIYFFIIPLSADYIAEQTPESWVNKISISTKKILDSTKSKVDLTLKEKIKLDKATLKLNNYKIDFKNIIVVQNNEFGANAFALPDGSIYVTDELVNSLDSDEIYAVLLHELGHVKYRHGLSLLIKSSFISLVLFAVVGGDWLNIPFVLLSTSYSRGAEAKADLYAKEELLKSGLSGNNLATALEKISKQNSDDSNWLLFLKTHPNTIERIKYLRE